MKDGLETIIASGQAPGFCGQHKDPTCADVAVPRAFRELERTQPADKICKSAGYSAKQIKSTWDFHQKL